MLNRTIKQILGCIEPPAHVYKGKAVAISEDWPALLFPNMLYGVEFEIEGMRRYQPEKLADTGWEIKHDGSLRNSGVEFTLCASGDSLLQNLTRLRDTLPETASFSERTSTHVHVNVQNMTLEQCWNFVLMCVLTEDLLYTFTNAERKRGVFCVPLKHTTLPFDLSYYTDRIKAVTTTNAAAAAVCNIVRMWHKYKGVNLGRLTDIGTFEFRHLHGTSDMPLVITWLNVLGKLKMYAMKRTNDELVSEISALNTTSAYEGFARSVFGSQLLRYFQLGPEFMKNLEDGVIAVKLITSKPSLILEEEIVAENTSVHKKLGMIGAGAVTYLDPRKTKGVHEAYLKFGDPEEVPPYVEEDEELYDDDNEENN